MNGVEAKKYSSWPIVGPTDSVMRLMRGLPLSREAIEEDQSRSDVWAVTRDLYVKWQTLTGGAIRPDDQNQQEDSL